MIQIKRALATAGTGAVLALSMAGVAAADASTTVDCTSDAKGISGNLCGGAAVDNSTTTTYTVSGNCSGIFQTTISQSQNSNTEQENESAGGLAVFGGNNNSSNSNSSSTSQSQSANGVTFSPNCSTTTTVAAAPAATPAAKQQVAAPAGGVHAGGGGAVSAASSTASVAGLVASVSSLGLGAIVRKKALLGL
jgi:hypothetical protein